uniref:Uncharacterized protein n=1 Tax=Arundo donax TaxID=35708 RepID=A0A0A9BM98_ARUDO
MGWLVCNGLIGTVVGIDYTCKDQGVLKARSNYACYNKGK